MLVRNLFLAITAAILASQIPAFFGFTDISPVSPMKSASVDVSILTPVTASSAGAVIRADGRGHFNASFRVNDKKIDAMIDTGASFVALNENTARRIGFANSQLDFRHVVDTANGQTKAAHVVLGTVEIGSIRIRDVDALVLRDSALNATLVGMSFLHKLSGFRVEGDIMKLDP